MATVRIHGNVTWSRMRQAAHDRALFRQTSPQSTFPVINTAVTLLRSFVLDAVDFQCLLQPLSFLLEPTDRFVSLLLRRQQLRL